MKKCDNYNTLCKKNHLYKSVVKQTRIGVFGLYLVLFSGKDDCILGDFYMKTQSKKLQLAKINTHNKNIAMKAR